MKNACAKGLLAVASLLGASACGSPGSRWPSTQPGAAHLESASISVGYCSPSYQAQFGWPDPEKAARVCRCESNGNPRAVSRNGLYAGLFQFSRATWQSIGSGGGDPFDPAASSERAYQLWRRRGWRPWPVCGRAR
jgi:hypothetical protein